MLAILAENTIGALDRVTWENQTVLSSVYQVASEIFRGIIEFVERQASVGVHWSRFVLQRHVWATKEELLLKHPERYPRILEVADRINQALQTELIPSRPSNGCGGAYILEQLAVFKPTDEEAFAPNNPKNRVGTTGSPGLRKGVQAGEGTVREAAAYLLDDKGFADVPPTCEATLTHTALFDPKEGNSPGRRLMKTKEGSLQLFVDHHCSLKKLAQTKQIRNLPAAEVHKVGIFDIRVMNTDRHLSNVLVRRADKVWRVFPIDHGLILPRDFSEARFHWLHLPQARTAFDKGTLRYISELQPDRDAVILRELGIDEAAVRVSRLTTLWLKKAAAAGWTLHQIGRFLVRPPLRGSNTEKPPAERSPSPFEKLVDRAKGSEETLLTLMDEALKL